jgi:signal transduction histidine kinase
MASLNRTIEDIRRYIFDLREAEDTRELETVLAGLVQDLRLDTLLEVDLEVKGERCCWLNQDQVGHVTQVAREALSNVVQHADASHVRVELCYQGDHTLLTVTDDGHGMDLSTSAEGDGSGHGIANMRARAHMLGGDLDVVSDPGSGSTLSLMIPCSECGSLESEPVKRQQWA